MMISGIVIAMLTLGGAKVDAATSPALQDITYHGIRPDDPGGRDGLRNPERGFRIETLIAEPIGKPAWGPAAHLRGRVTAGYSNDWWVLDAQRYSADGLTLAQTYCYLDRYINGPIPADELNRLQDSFDRLRACGLKALLRFAYERDMKRKAGPTFKTILRHIDQLKPIIQKNADLIYVLQAGFVGAWGEWHDSAHRIENNHAELAAIVARLLDILPRDRMIQLRVPKYKRWVLSEPVLAPFTTVTAATAFSGIPAARIGFDDDGFLAETTDGGTWPEPPHFANPGNPEFDYMTRESPYVAVDGELFWSDQGGVVDGLRAAKRMRLQHYTSFSLAHSYSEREGKRYSIDQWKKTPLTLDEVRKAGLPVSDAYFEDGEGNSVTRTAFEYIRDHLGYRIELQRAHLPKAIRPGAPLTIDVELINRGFAVPINPRNVYFVLVNAHGAVALTCKTAADPHTWQPAEQTDGVWKPLIHRIHLETKDTAGLAPGSYAVGLWMPDSSARLSRNPRYAIRVANRDTPWWTNASGEYGVNLIASLKVQPGSH